MNNDVYNAFKFQFKRGYDKEIYDKLKETEDLIKSFHERFQDKCYKQTNNNSLVDKLTSCLGYFSILRDKLEDELVFNKDTLRSISIQVKRLEKGLETKKSELEIQVELRDSTRKEFTIIQDKRGKTDKSLPDYINLQEDYFNAKKRKESAEEAVRKNVNLYNNEAQAVELMKATSEQSKMSLDQGKEILEWVEKAIEEINTVYPHVMFIISDKKKVLQITGGNDDNKR